MDDDITLPVEPGGDGGNGPRSTRRNEANEGRTKFPHEGDSTFCSSSSRAALCAVWSERDRSSKHPGRPSGVCLTDLFCSTNAGRRSARDCVVLTASFVLRSLRSFAVNLLRFLRPLHPLPRTSRTLPNSNEALRHLVDYLPDLEQRVAVHQDRGHGS